MIGKDDNCLKIIEKMVSLLVYIKTKVKCIKRTEKIEIELRRISNPEFQKQITKTKRRKSVLSFHARQVVWF